MLLGAMLALGAAACSEGCLDNKNSLPKAGFYSSVTGEAVSVSGLSVGGVGAPHDSLLLRDGTVSEIYLPFRAASTDVSYRFAVALAPGDTISDEVTFEYETTPYFVSEECGAMYRYRITGVWFDGNLIDSVAVTDSLITNVDAERIKIYLYGSPQ